MECWGNSGGRVTKELFCSILVNIDFNLKNVCILNFVGYFWIFGKHLKTSILAIAFKRVLISNSKILFQILKKKLF